METPAQAEPSLEWTYIEGSELPIRLRIPFASEWQRRETKTTLRLEHPRERVRAVVRLWQSSRQASEDQCLTELSLVEPELASAQVRARSHPETTEAPGRTTSRDPEVIVSKPFDPEPGFHGHLRAQVAAAPANAGMYASVIGVATGGSGRCLSFLANTVAEGASAEQQIGERLEWIVDGMAKSLSVRTSEERVQKAPFPLH